MLTLIFNSLLSVADEWPLIHFDLMEYNTWNLTARLGNCYFTSKYLIKQQKKRNGEPSYIYVLYVIGLRAMESKWTKYKQMELRMLT